MTKGFNTFDGNWKKNLMGQGECNHHNSYGGNSQPIKFLHSFREIDNRLGCFSLKNPSGAPLKERSKTSLERATIKATARRVDNLYKTQLTHAPTQDSRFMNEQLINALLEDLKNPDEDVRNQATEELWRIWFQQKGQYGFERLERSQTLFTAGDVKQAEALLTQLIHDLPDFAEAWNRRAVLYYLLGEYQKSRADCLEVIKLNPVHFGALHGLGLCYAALGQYRAAIQSFRKALAIQPYALVNQKLILECTARLS